MPYILQDKRKELEEFITNKLDTAGDFNYFVTRLSLAYLERHGERYQSYNDIMGALEGVKLELYRRRAAPYEDIKAKENGDVY